MGSKRSPEELAQYNGIDEILWRDWDPIGISTYEDWPRDEYYAYVSDVFHLAVRGSPAIAIAEYLSNVATERMGLPATVKDEFAVAEKIRALKLCVMPE